MNKDLLIFGAGNIGQRVGQLWKTLFSSANIYPVTSKSSQPGGLKCPYVLFSVPPTDNYEELATRALKHWDETGNFVFTSSTSVFLENSGATVTERSKLNPESRIFPTEKLIEQDGGCIVRLAGLYDDQRGPHLHLRRTMKIRSSQNSYLNLIHSDDAASLCVQALQFGKASSHYLGCDNHPIRQIDFAKSVLGKDASQVEFGVGPDSGKQCNSNWTREVLKWQPKHAKFQ